MFLLKLHQYIDVHCMKDVGGDSSVQHVMEDFVVAFDSMFICVKRL